MRLAAGALGECVLVAVRKAQGTLHVQVSIDRAGLRDDDTQIVSGNYLDRYDVYYVK